MVGRPPRWATTLALAALAGAAEPPAWVGKLRAANCASPTHDVQEMYEDLPYPRRDPADEKPGQPFAIDVPSTPAAIAHHLFGGDIDFAALNRPFRILVAGGGTGDATVMAAASFDAANLPLDIVHVDLSAASIAIAQQRIAAHNLSEGVRVTFKQVSFLTIGVDDIGGPVDFVNSAGVVHHLASPLAGLTALTKLLRPEGGMFLMVYGEIGRSGVYDMQDMWRMSKLSRREFLKGNLQALMKALPSTNRLAVNRRMMTQKVKQGDLTTLSDLLAHHCDHAYTVASLLELLAEADLELVAFADPDKYAIPAEIKTITAPFVAQMEDELERFHFAELLRGDIYAHSFWVAPAADAPTLWPRRPRPPLPKVSAASILCPAWSFNGYRIKLSDDDREKCFKDGALPGATAKAGKMPPATCSLYIDQVANDDLPCLAVPLLERMDCGQTIAELHAQLAAEVAAARPGASALTLDDTVALAAGLYHGLSTLAERKVFLISTPLAFRREPWREKAPRVVLKRDWDAFVEVEDSGEAASESGSAEL